MPSKGPLLVFHRQKSTAKGRGIPWELTYKQWLRWWTASLGPDWFELRGAGYNQFCMARHNDTGAYKLGNIKCITNQMNRAEQQIKHLAEYNRRSVPKEERRRRAIKSWKTRRARAKV